MKASEVHRKNGDVQHTYSRLPRNPRPATDRDLVSTLKAREVKRSPLSIARSKKQVARDKDEAATNQSQSAPAQSTSGQATSSAQLLESTAPTEDPSTSAEASAFESIDRSDNSRASFQQPGMSRRQSNAFVFDAAAPQLGLDLDAPLVETETAPGDSDEDSFDEGRSAVVSGERRLGLLRR
jgi:hypothetical protein